jgi:hypothetical protein
MGMFDYIECDYPLPDAPDWASTCEFQTKDFGNHLDLYRITPEGRLITRCVKRQWVDDEKSYMGGFFKVVEQWEEDTNYHGDFNFYGFKSLDDFQWLEYRVRFTNGQLEKIERIIEEQS